MSKKQRRVAHVRSAAAAPGPGVGVRLPSPRTSAPAARAAATSASVTAPAIASPPTASDELAAQIVAEAENAIKAGLKQEAQALCRTALALGPTSPAVRHAIARAYFGCESIPEAIDILAAIVAADADASSGIYRDLIRCLLSYGRAAEGAAVARRGMAAHGESGDLLAGLGAALRREGRLGPAVTTLERAAHRPDAPPVAHGELAVALMAAGRYAEAVQEHATASYLAGVPMAGSHIGAYRTSSVKAWCRTAPAPYRSVFAARIGFAFRPQYRNSPALCEPVPTPQPEVYLAEIPEASIVCGQGIVLTAAASALFDPLFWPNASRVDLSGSTIPYLDARSALIDVPAVAPDSIPAGILLQGFGANNYYHWLVEYLPRLLVLERCGVAADVPLLVDRRTLAIPQLVDALAAVDRDHRPIVALEPDVEYKVDRLFLASSLAWLAPNLRDHLPLEFGDSLIAAEAVAFLRERLGAPGPDRVGTRRLYIARRASTSPVRLVNEPETQAVFLEAGFEAVHPDRLSFEEQRALFADADVIASESGAGLANLLMAPPSATLICLQAEEWAMNVYADLAGHIGQRAVFVAGDVVGDRPLKPYHARFTVPPERLRAVLDNLGPQPA